jgi:hypothetical protein
MMRGKTSVREGVTNDLAQFLAVGAASIFSATSVTIAHPQLSL